MAQRIETITQHVFAFDPWEVNQIYTALREGGYDDLADEIEGEMDVGCERAPEGGYERLERIHERRSDCGSRSAREWVNSLEAECENEKSDEPTIVKIGGEGFASDFLAEMFELINRRSEGRVIIERV